MPESDFKKGGGGCDVLLGAKHWHHRQRLWLRFHRKWVSTPLTDQLPIINHGESKENVTSPDTVCGTRQSCARSLCHSVARGVRPGSGRRAEIGLGRRHLSQPQDPTAPSRPGSVTVFRIGAEEAPIRKRAGAGASGDFPKTLIAEKGSTASCSQPSQPPANTRAGPRSLTESASAHCCPFHRK